MSLTAILGGLASLATIVGGTVWLVKWSAWKFQKTPAQTDAQIDAEIEAEKRKGQETGIPE